MKGTRTGWQTDNPIKQASIIEQSVFTCKYVLKCILGTTKQKTNPIESEWKNAQKR